MENLLGNPKNLAVSGFLPMNNPELILSFGYILGEEQVESYRDLSVRLLIQQFKEDYIG